MENGYCKTAAEEMVYHTNHKMIYHDRAYYDFLVNRKTDADYIKVEVITGERKMKNNKKSKNRIRFRIRNGIWLKSLGSDFIVVINNEKFCVGYTSKINEYIIQELEEKQSLVERSFRPWKRSGRRTSLQKSSVTLEQLGLLKSYPLPTICQLESLIQETYEKQIR